MSGTWMSALESSVLPSHTPGAERKKCGEADMSAHSPTPFRGMGSRTFRVTLLVYICEALSQSRSSSQVNAESTGRLALSEIAEPQWRGWTACRTPQLTCKHRRERITTLRGSNYGSGDEHPKNLLNHTVRCGRTHLWGVDVLRWCVMRLRTESGSHSRAAADVLLGMKYRAQNERCRSHLSISFLSSRCSHRCDCTRRPRD